MKSVILAALLAGTFSQAAVAAEDRAPDFVLDLHRHLAAADDARLQPDAWKRWADDFSREMRTSMGSLFSSRVISHRLVKGAPYSARVVTELNQPLADGNVISHHHEGAVYRDGEGRTREETVADGKPGSIVINDPVEKRHFVLIPGLKRAVETAAPGVKEAKLRSKQVVKVDGREIRVEDGKVSVDGKETNETVVVRARNGKEIRVENGKVTIDGKDVGQAHGAGSHVIVNTIETPEGGRREEVRVQVVRTGDDASIPTVPRPPMAPPAPPAPPAPLSGAAAPMPPMPPMPPIPGVQTMRFESTARLGKGVTSSLGTREFDGVKAEGRQTTWTIPAGEIGNRNPIQVVSETWYSPELQVTVYSRYNDPRTGESIYRLAGIKRGEPAPDLFRVPPDYEIRNRGR